MYDKVQTSYESYPSQLVMCQSLRPCRTTRGTTKFRPFRSGLPLGGTIHVFGSYLSAPGAQPVIQNEWVKSFRWSFGELF